jgi:hypothetical protein
VRRRVWLAGLALFAATQLPAVAGAQEGTLGMISRLRYCASGGMMAGVGPQGRDLWRGPYASFNVHGESVIGMELGVEGAYASSDDVLRTKFLSLGAIARLSPMPEDYRAFVQVGVAMSSVTFEPKIAGLETPGDKVRPAGSFGIGIDFLELKNVAVGGLVTYNGVIFKRDAARSYLVAALSLTFKASRY